MARRSGRSSQRRKRTWVGTTGAGTVATGAITAGNSAVIPIITSEPTGAAYPTSYTIQRTRGRYGFTLPATGANTQCVVGLGWIVLPDSVAESLTAFSVTSGIPDPVIDSNEDWFWVDYANAGALNNAIFIRAVNDSAGPMFDSKAQRVVKAGERPVFIVAVHNYSGTTTSSVTFEFGLNGRLLLLE